MTHKFDLSFLFVANHFPSQVMKQSCRFLFEVYSVLGPLANSEVLNSIKADLQSQKQTTESSTLAACLTGNTSLGGIDHLESPEADAKHVEKVNRLTDDFFSKLPTPCDWKSAALAKSKFELEQDERLEALQEAMRARYRSSKRMQRMENDRIDLAMEAVNAGQHSSQVGEKVEPRANEEELMRLRQRVAELEDREKRISMLRNVKVKRQKRKRRPV